MKSVVTVAVFFLSIFSTQALSNRSLSEFTSSRTHLLTDEAALTLFIVFIFLVCWIGSKNNN